ncbi:MAG TPA: alpha/beta hydrolase [Terriglobia bacterium]|nr:alpha/beta hydrolase [Terriglobia bacterium]
MMRRVSKNTDLWITAAAVVAIALMAAPSAHAQVPPDVAAQLRQIGTGVCVPETAKLYKPLQPPPPSGVTVMRDIPYVQDDPRAVMDLFAPEKGGGGRPVLVYVSGGGGDKKVTGPDGDPFYDNIMYWALKNGMVGVNMQRRGGFGGGAAWDAPAKDVGLVVTWIRQNIKKYKGNPNRIFLWADSAGNGPVSTYAGHPEIAGADGAAVKGIVLMSAPNFNIAPETVSADSNAAAIAATASLSTTCGRPAGEGRGARGPGRGSAAAGAGGRGGAAPAQVDQATQLARSNLPGLAKGKIAVFMAWGELDSRNILSFDLALKNALCKTGRCPTTAELIKDHSHVSLVFSPNTADDSVTGPILKWMKSVK